jgi:hypothetical protein
MTPVDDDVEICASLRSTHLNIVEDKHSSLQASVLSQREGECGAKWAYLPLVESLIMEPSFSHAS